MSTKAFPTSNNQDSSEASTLISKSKHTTASQLGAKCIGIVDLPPSDTTISSASSSPLVLEEELKTLHTKNILARQQIFGLERQCKRLLDALQLCEEEKSDLKMELVHAAFIIREARQQLKHFRNQQ